MKRTINSMEKGKDVGISPAEETPIPGFPTEYQRKIPRKAVMSDFEA